eukprot:591388-Amphidinium_carterae.1
MEQIITELGACNARSLLAEIGCHHVLALAAQRYMAGEAVQYMSDFAQQTILLQFSADSTPIRCREALRVTASGGVSVNRRGKRSLDFQVMACSLTTPMASGGYKSLLLFREPLSLSTKKAAGLAGTFFKCPGVADQCIDVLSGKWASEISAGPMNFDGEATELDPDSVRLTEWHTWAHCACHAAHNSLKWSLHAAFDDPSLLKMCYVGLQSSRACYLHLTEGLRQWLDEVLQPLTEELLPSESDLAAMWSVCDLSPEVQQGLLQYRLWFADGRMKVLGTATRNENFILDITAILMSAWHTETFCGSRWCTIGSSCRSMMRAWVLGYHECMSFLRSQRLGITEYMSSAYFQISKEA